MVTSDARDALGVPTLAEPRPVAGRPREAATRPTVHQAERLFDSAPAGPYDVLAAVPHWWTRRTRAAGLPGAWTDWRQALGPPPVRLNPTPRIDFSDGDAFALGEVYAGTLSRSERLAHGRHYTPRLLADELWAELDVCGRSDSGAVDPACGAGALLLPAMRRLLNSRVADDDPARTLRRVETEIVGIDSDPMAVWLGNAILGAELLPLWARLPPERRRPLPQLLRVGDGLSARSRRAVTVMNPPYGRVGLSTSQRKRWSRTLYGHANRFGIFLQAAVEMTLPGGLIGAVMPASFLGGAYYQRLRAFLVEEAPLARLVFVDERAGVFASGVLQETCLAVFRRDGTPGEVACSAQRVNGRVARRQLGCVPLNGREPDLPWLLPRSEGDVALIERAAHEPARLRDYGWKASTGPLVWNRHKRQITPEQAHASLPIVWAADFSQGRVLPRAERASQRWFRPRARDSFMRLSEPAVLVQRTTAPEQPRRLVSAQLDADTLRGAWGGNVVVENHVNVLRCSQGDSPLTPSLLLALLSSDVLDRLYRCLSGTVAVSAYELEALPLPPEPVIRAWADEPLSEVPRLAAEFYG